MNGRVGPFGVDTVGTPGHGGSTRWRGSRRPGRRGGRARRRRVARGV